MSNDLQKYKKNKLDTISRIYQNNLAKLTAKYNNDLISIQKSRFRISIKREKLRTTTAVFNSNKASLKLEYDKQVQKIQNFSPIPISITGKKYALLVGINYKDSPYELNGCINDAIAIKDRLTSQGFDDIVLITDNTTIKPTKENILSQFSNLTQKNGQGNLLFYFISSHGTQTRDKNNDETDGLDECNVSSDFQLIVDDDYRQIINANLRTGTTLCAFSDSCFSGSLMDLKYMFMDSLNYDNFTINPNVNETNGDVIYISGCNDKQTSADAFIDGKSNGAMTWALLKSLNENKNITWRELLKNMRQKLKDNGYVQIPQLSCGNFELIDGKCFL